MQYSSTRCLNLFIFGPVVISTGLLLLLTEAKFFLSHQGCASIAVDKMDKDLMIVGVGGIVIGIVEVKLRLNMEERKNNCGRN